jgi:hypothetical protein
MVSRPASLVILPALALFLHPQDRSLEPWKVIDQQYGYRAAVDTQVAHGGVASGHVTALGATATVSMFVSQGVKADEYRGKRVRFSAWLRARNAGMSAGMGAVLFLRAEGNGAALASYSTGNRPVGGNSEWKKKQIVLDIPATAVGLAFGFGMGGPGEMWMDDAMLEVVDAAVPVSRPPTRPPAPDRAKARQQDKLYAALPTQPVNMDFEKK